MMGARRGFTVKAQPADGNVYVVARKQVDTWLRRRIAISDAPEIWRSTTSRGGPRSGLPDQGGAAATASRLSETSA